MYRWTIDRLRLSHSAGDDLVDVIDLLLGVISCLTEQLAESTKLLEVQPPDEEGGSPHPQLSADEQLDHAEVLDRAEEPRMFLVEDDLLLLVGKRLQLPGAVTCHVRKSVQHLATRVRELGVLILHHLFFASMLSSSLGVLLAVLLALGTSFFQPGAQLCEHGSSTSQTTILENGHLVDFLGQNMEVSIPV